MGDTHGSGLRLRIGGAEGKLLSASAGTGIEVTRGTGDVVLVVDQSDSMAGRKLAAVREGIGAFAAGAIDSGYRVALHAFDDVPHVLERGTMDVARITTAAGRLKASGTTEMAAAIERAYAALATSTASTRAMVIFTDGQPNDREATIRAARRVAATGIDIVAIGTDDADRELLAAIASRPDLAIPVIRHDIARGFQQAALLLGEGPGRRGDR